jgi:hypothetical protein
MFFDEELRGDDRKVDANGRVTSRTRGGSPMFACGRTPVPRSADQRAIEFLALVYVHVAETDRESTDRT